MTLSAVKDLEAPEPCWRQRSWKQHSVELRRCRSCLVAHTRETSHGWKSVATFSPLGF